MTGEFPADHIATVTMPVLRGRIFRASVRHWYMVPILPSVLPSAPIGRMLGKISGEPSRLITAKSCWPGLAGMGANAKTAIESA